MAVTKDEKNHTLEWQRRSNHVTRSVALRGPHDARTRMRRTSLARWCSAGNDRRSSVMITARVGELGNKLGRVRLPVSFLSNS